jgi:8-oxo-dGTP diphosphatase
MKKDSGEPKHLRFAVLASDVALVTVRDGELLIRLAPVHRPPHFPNMEGLPGGLIDPKETAEDAARRLIQTKGLIQGSDIYLEQLYTFSELTRDPRGRVVAVAYLAFIPWESLTKEEQAGTADAWWSPLREVKGLAYDHDLILKTALARLRSRARYTTIVSKLMPLEFTLTDLERVYESILRTELDKRNFRKKILKLGVLTALGRKRSGGAFRPAELYRFTKPGVVEIEVL